jgi:putative CocE/NonD family hydrolase
MDDPGKWHWESSEAWPPPEAKPLTFWFERGPTESVESVNDGLLSLTAPTDKEQFDNYKIDSSTTTGTSTRWDNAVGAAPVMLYKELAENDRKALTYTTPILEEPLTVVGHPVVTLFVSASEDDADIHVYLEEVDMEGNVRYVTEGVLRGSHRKLGEAPYDNMGLPYQRSFEEDRSPLPQGAPTEMVMDLHPTANVFDAGHYLRIAITGADADNTEATTTVDPSRIRIFRDTDYASRIVLPVVR